MAWNEPGGNGSKDPWGHRKNEQGPPDLDEIVKKIHDKLNRFFGGRGSTSAGGGGNGLNSSAVGILFIVLLTIWGLFGFYIIQPAEQGVETRFGRYTETTEQGLRWHIPYPIEAVTKVNVQQINAINHKALMLTQDENIVEIELVVQYRVKDAKDYLFQVRDPDNTLHQATESALREIVGTSRMDDVLTTERARVATETKAVIQTIIDRYKTGLLVASVNMQDAQPPAAVQEAFEDVIKAREDEERHKNKAQAYANQVVQRAGGTADRLRQEAQAYKAQVVAHAEGETKRFLSVLTEYEKAPEVTRQRLYLETMESVLSDNNKIIVDIQNGHNLMMLELGDLLKNGSVKGLPQIQSPTSSDKNGDSKTSFSQSYTPDDRKRRSPEELRDRGRE